MIGKLLCFFGLHDKEERMIGEALEESGGYRNWFVRCRRCGKGLRWVSAG